MRTNGIGGNEVLTLLLVTAECQYEESLRAILAGTTYSIRRAAGCGEALQLLNDLNSGVVLLEADRPAGNWRHLLEGVLARPCPPQFIVFSSFADGHLWAEVLNLGGYDVLAVPFRPEEVLRTVALAQNAHTRLSMSSSATAA